MSLGWRLRTALGGLKGGTRAPQGADAKPEHSLSYAPEFDLNDRSTYDSLLQAPRDMSPIPAAQRAHLIDAYWQAHPRFQFFKALPQDARLLDVGAGSGGLALWRDYMQPARNDVSMFAVDMYKGEYFDRYQGFQICNLDTDAISFEANSFEAALASHLLEHVKSPSALLSQIADKLKVGGVCYLEVPSWHTKELPHRDRFTALGWPMMISNFFDDGTHLETFQLDELVALGRSAGMTPVASGFITNPFLADRMMAFGIEHQDAELLLYGFWMRTRWAQYALFEKR
jgi:SAM-dependent methyltransferase